MCKHLKDHYNILKYKSNSDLQLHDFLGLCRANNRFTRHQYMFGIQVDNANTHEVSYFYNTHLVFQFLDNFISTDFREENIPLYKPSKLSKPRQYSQTCSFFALIILYKWRNLNCKINTPIRDSQNILAYNCILLFHPSTQNLYTRDSPKFHPHKFDTYNDKGNIPKLQFFLPLRFLFSINPKKNKIN